MSIEFRRLKADGHCSYCGAEIKKDTYKVRIVKFYHRSKCPTINICRDCSYKIFYAPTLADKETGIVEDNTYDINQK